MGYCVYMLLCGDGSYYTGYTQDLMNRLKQHLSGVGSRYTRMRKPIRVVYVELFDSRSDAMRHEKKIKRLTHREKSQLLNNEIT